MKFKIRADVIMSKVLEIEAEHIGEAMEKAQEQMVGQRVSVRELSEPKVAFTLLSGINGERD